MSKYSNFVGYVPDKLRLVTSGGGLSSEDLGLSAEFIAGLAFGPVSTGNPLSGPGLGLNAPATFVIQSGCSYIDFQNVIGTTDSITVTGEGEGGGTDFEANFSSLEYVGNQITGRSDRLKKLSLSALKRIDSLDSTSGIALYYSGGNDVTGEVYSPNLTQAAGLGVYINYGSGGLNNIDNTFSSFISGSVSVFGFTGYASGNATITPNTDFLSGMKAGNVYFEAPSNYQEIKIAQNNSGIGNIQSYSINAHQNTTGIVVPRIGNSPTRIRISGASTATGDLTVHFTGTPISSTGYARIFSTVPTGVNTNLVNAYTGIHQIALGKTLNVINDHIHLISYYGSFAVGVNNRFCGVQSSGDLNFSGNCLTGLIVDWTANDGGGLNFFTFRSNNNLNFSTTGSVFNGWGTAASGGDTRGYAPVAFQSISGNVNATFLNATQANGLFTLQLYSSGTTGVLSFPELTGSPDDTEKPSYVPTVNVPFFGLTISPGSANAVNTIQILNIPKLHNISGNLTIQGLSGSTTTISGADLTFVSGALSIASSGDAYFTFTGGPGSGSGSIRNGVQITGYLPGTTISGNLGSIVSVSGLNTTTASGGTISLTATGLQTISGNLALNTSGNIFITGSSTLSVQSGVFVTGLSNSTININSNLLPGTTAVVDAVSGAISITGGHTGPATGVLSSNFLVTGRTSSSAITGVFNGIQTISGNFIVNSSGNTDLQLTGLSRIVSGVFVTGFVNNININSNLLPGTTAVVDSTSGVISITGGHTGPATGVLSSNFLVTGRTSSSVITGVFNGIQTITGSLGISSSGNVNLQSTGLTQLGQNLTVLGAASSSTITGTFNNLQTITGNFIVNSSGNTDLQLTGLNRIVSGVFITGFINTININSSLVPGTTAVIDSVSGTISITGGHTGSATGVLSSNFLVTGRTSSSAITGIFNGIQTISGNLNVISSGNTNVELTGLAQVSGLIDIQSLAASTFKHPLENATSLTGVGIIATGTTQRTVINITGNSITGITAPNLARVGNILGEYSYTSGFIISTGIRNISLPSLTGWHTKLRIETPNITGFNMSGIRYIGATGSFATLNNVNSLSGFTFIAGTGLTGELNFGNLEQLHIYSARTLSAFPGSDTPNTNVFFVAGSGLTSINMSGLVTGIYKVANSGNSGETYNTTFQCTGVTGMRFGTSGTTKLLQMNFIASGCPLNQASVDQILQTFASLDGTNSTAVYSGRTITLNGLCAAPSAAGSGFRTTLTGAGRLCTVLVNT